MPHTSQTVPSAPANAKTAIGERPHSVQLNPLMTAIIAPSPAPLEMPSIYGSARGLRKSAWKTTPEHASAAPTMQARIIRGNLTDTNTAFNGTFLVPIKEHTTITATSTTSANVTLTTNFFAVNNSFTTSFLKKLRP
jgi:hypothetical protein